MQHAVPARRQLTSLDMLGTRLLLAAVAVVAAYHYSLLTLVRDLGLDTPLAYLGLVPLIAVGVGVMLPRAADSLDIHDRQLDLIIGLPLVIGTVVALHVLPLRMSALFWSWRIDLLTLPFFVFGVSVLLFGLRPTWRYRVPLAFLLLAWPLPYTLLVDHTLQLTTDSTISAVKAGLHVLPVAKAVPGVDNSLLTVTHGTKPFNVSIASACAGVNSIVGFVIVGTAFLAVTRVRAGLRGGLTRKLVWLALGLGLVWALNVVRLLAVLAAGHEFGESVAINGLHPVIGLFTFSTAVLIALLVMSRLGLETRTATKRIVTPLRAAVRGPVAAARGVRLAGLAVLVSAGLLIGTNGSFAHYELVAGDLSTARLQGFAQSPADIPGFTSASDGNYPWVRQFFGSKALWNRYSYSALGAAPVDRKNVVPAVLTSNGFVSHPVVVDAIQGTSLNDFNAYGVEACYAFHGYPKTGQQRIDLGHNVFGNAITFRDSEHATTYNVVYWVWPVQTPQGKRYERVTLLQQDTTGALTPNDHPFAGVGAAAPVGPKADALKAQNAAVLATERSALAVFAKEVVNHQAQAVSAPVVTSTQAART